MKKRENLLAFAALPMLFAGIAALCAYLVYSGVIKINNPSRDEYPVRGADVSSYQGEIDWQVLSGEGLDFVFIKATEGSGYADPNFEYNYENARRYGLRVGAYHFFSFESPGQTQAENFISTVQKTEGMLPPVIDVEFYGGFYKNRPERTAVVKELEDLVGLLEEHYGLAPLIYATGDSYDTYIAGGFFGCGIWARNMFFEPKLSDGREWTFWQYTNRERLSGYDGPEKFIDMNVFNGSREEFAAYAMDYPAM